MLAHRVDVDINKRWNLLLLEIFYHIFRGQDPKSLAQRRERVHTGKVYMNALSGVSVLLKFHSRSLRRC